MKNIVFDVGMVVVDFRWREYMHDMGIESEIIDILGKSMIEDSLWNEFDLGIKADEDIVDAFKKKLPEYTREIDMFMDNPIELVREFDYAGPLVKSLKAAGYNVYLLSNYPKRMYEMHWSRFSFIDEIDGMVVSSLEKVMKPDRKIYEILLDRYNLEASETCFIDDRENNIEAARKLGIEGIVFKGYEDLLEKFDELQVKFIDE